MKLKQFLSVTTALTLCFALAACGNTASSPDTATSESADSAASATSSDTAQEADPYADLAGFTYGDGFDENGYLVGITASEYVTLPENFDELEFPSGIDEVSDEDVMSYIEQNILAGYATRVEITDRAAEMGDMVNIDYVGSIDGVEFEGGNSGGKGYDLTLGSHSFIDDFEDQIAGHKPGETFDVKATFPESYDNADLAGKEAVFVTTLHYIVGSELPELTDDWVKENTKETFGFETADALRSYVRENLVFQQQTNEIYNQLMSSTAFAEELPESALEYMKKCSLMGPYQYAAMYNVSVEEFLAMIGFESVDAFLEQSADNIENSVKEILLVQAIAEKLELTCDDAMLDSELKERFGNSDPAGYLQTYGTNYARMGVLHDLCMESLIETATIGE